MAGGTMRRRWYYFKWKLRQSRPRLLLIGVVIAILAVLFFIRLPLFSAVGEIFDRYGVLAVSEVMEEWFGGGAEKKEGLVGLWSSYLEKKETESSTARDPAYGRMLAGKTKEQKWAAETEAETAGQDREENNEETVSVKPVGNHVLLAKLADYDYLMKNFYVVHPTTTANRDMMNAETFLSMDLSIDKNAEKPQILIYHTHSQEEFSDYPENPDATIVGVGAYLKELLEAQGYCVIHDTSVYDKKDGKLDRSQAYTYALEGITGILQKNPTIEVVLDVHRDGVDENTRLVTEINGKPTAKIMFFNGTSQTPDGEIEYLPNPNREANLAFSFQMQLAAAEKYPDFTRKIYLKGLRYNQHVRARSALIEVGAQTNYYAEALNAMEPLADILTQVLEAD